jgi:hypothetical protein
MIKFASNGMIRFLFKMISFFFGFLQPNVVNEPRAAFAGDMPHAG